MKKDSYYFPHYINARNDRKVKRVIKELGLEGYAIFFMLLELLREQLDFRYPIKDIDLIADEFGTSEQKVRVVICNYDLFQIDSDDNFLSIKQIYYLQPYIEKTDRARVAARKRWDSVKLLNANADANALQMQCDSNTNAMQGKENKERKENEKKESKVFSSPTKDLIFEYLNIEKNIDYQIAEIEADKFFNFYESNGWRVGKNKMKNWKAAANNWINNLNKFAKNGTTKQTAESWSADAREWTKDFKGLTVEEIFGRH